MSTNNWKLSAFTLCTLLAASPLAAGETPWSVTAKIGRADVDRDFGPEVLGWGVDDEDTSASIEVGYDFHRKLGVQAGFHDLGTYPGFARPCPPGVICPFTLVPVDPTEVDFAAFSLSLIPRLPLTERVGLYGKLGVLAWEGDPVWPHGPQSDAEPSERELLAGLGARYAFTWGLGLLVEHQRSDLLRETSVGMVWRF